MAKKHIEQPAPAVQPYPEPPPHLSAPAAELWRKLGPEYCRSLQRQTLFLASLEARDRADQARQEIAVQGMITTTASTGAVHVNPLLKVEREARAQFVSIWSTLKLARYEVDDLFP